MRYLSARQISEQYDFCMKTARTLIAEIRSEIQRGRYPPESILEGCGIRINERVLINYLKNRRALKNEIARNYVEEYREAEDACRSD